MVDAEMAHKQWGMGDAFSMADCAAAPALFYADKALPLAGSHRYAAAYLDRLKQRSSFARVLEEAQPYFRFFPE
jgi:glutathione S-transferase